MFTIVIYCIARLAFLNYTSTQGKAPLIYEREINCLVYLKLGVIKRNIIFNVWRRAQGVINSYSQQRKDANLCFVLGRIVVAFLRVAKEFTLHFLNEVRFNAHNCWF